MIWFFISLFFCSSAAFDSQHYLLLTSETSRRLYFIFFPALRRTNRRRLLSLRRRGLCKLYRRGFLIRQRRSFYQGNSTPSSVVCRRWKTHKHAHAAMDLALFPLLKTHWCRYFLFRRPPRSRDNRHTFYSRVSWFASVGLFLFLPLLIYISYIYTR